MRRPFRGRHLLEVLVSPVMEACPSGHKEQAMSLLLAGLWLSGSVGKPDAAG